MTKYIYTLILLLYTGATSAQETLYINMCELLENKRGKYHRQFYIVVDSTAYQLKHIKDDEYLVPQKIIDDIDSDKHYYFYFETKKYYYWIRLNRNYYSREFYFSAICNNIRYFPFVHCKRVPVFSFRPIASCYTQLIGPLTSERKKKARNK